MDNIFDQHAHTFILFIDEVLKSQGKSRYWLAKETGIPESSLSRYFNLEIIPPLNIFLKVCHAVQLNIFFQTRDSETSLNKEFERAMERLGRRPDKLPKN